MRARAGTTETPADIASPAPDTQFVRHELETRLRSKRLTPGQRRLVQCLIERSADIGELSSTELADLAKLSQPSVTRFAAALGFDGFLDMRRQLRARRSAPAAHDQTLNKYQSAASAEAANVAALMHALGDTRKMLAVGRGLAGSRPLVVLGLRASAGMARQFCYFGSKIHPDIRLCAEGGSLVEDQIEQAVAAGATHLLAFMMPLYPRESLKALHHAKSLHMKTILVGDATYSDPDGIVDIPLLARINTSLVFDSYASCGVLVSVLLDAMCEAMGDEAQRRLESNERSSTRRKVFGR